MATGNGKLPFEPISAEDTLRRNRDYIKIADLKERSEPFYVGNFLDEVSERGRKSADNPDGPGIAYVFDVVDLNGENIGVSMTATLGLMKDVDAMIAKANGDRTRFHGPVSIVQDGKAHRFAPARATS